MSRRPLRSPSVLAAVTAAMVGATLVTSAAATATASATPASSAAFHGTAPAHAGTAPRTASYTNPVSRGFADTFADPSVIRGKDGWWYAYGTSDPLREGEGTRAPHPDRAVARPGELDVRRRRVHRRARCPRWADKPDAGLWAPDIRYVDGQYRMYYVVTQTTVTRERDDNAIGMATAPTPAGPWTDSGEPVVGPRRRQRRPGNFLWTFDPSAVTDADGSQWLFYGSYYGGIFVSRLTDDGTRRRSASRRRWPSTTSSRAPTSSAATATGTSSPPPRTAAPARRPATASRSAAPATCRARTSTAQGVPLTRLARRRHAGAQPERQPLGRRRAQRDRHRPGRPGLDRLPRHRPADPYLDGTYGINERPMLLDRLDWVDGWPRVRAGRGPSERSEQAPVTGGRVDRLLPRRRRPALDHRPLDQGAGRPVRHLPATSGAGGAHSVLGHRGRAGRGRPAFLRRGIRAGRVRPRQGSTRP